MPISGAYTYECESLQHLNDVLWLVPPSIVASMTHRAFHGIPSCDVVLALRRAA